MAALVIHGGDKLIASQGMIDGCLGQGRAPEVQQEAALLAGVSN
jgi:hypothetical protein